MRKTLLLLFPFLTLFVLFACKKHNDTLASQGLGGTWIFLTANVQTQVTEDFGGGVTMASNANFFTRNNTGTMTFNTDSMVIRGLGYSVDTTTKANFYLNNVLYGDTLVAVSYTVPPTSSTAKYSIIGSDSLYFPKGGILTALDSTSKGQGGRYTINGDSLTLATHTTDTTNGAVSVSLITLKLKRQK
jgi:hypothetical protein